VISAYAGLKAALVLGIATGLVALAFVGGSKALTLEYLGTICGSNCYLQSSGEAHTFDIAESFAGRGVRMACSLINSGESYTEHSHQALNGTEYCLERLSFNNTFDYLWGRVYNQAGFSAFVDGYATT
jgi:hypothetical protein